MISSVPIANLGSSNTPSDLKKLVEAADYNFKNLVFNGNKSKNYTGTFNDNAKIDYKYFNACEGNLALLNNADNTVVTVTVPNVSAYTFGYMVYFFEYACGVSGYTLGVNPFNQPGVEAYKKNMFALLGKPGYEEKQAELLAKLGK